MKGFVFGKFLPFHKGHEAMIRFAKEKCDHLLVIICCSDKENIPSETRLRWLQETFKSEPKIELIILEYLESELPNTSVSDEKVSGIWAEKFMEILPDVDLLVTSEPYGVLVARFMNISHISFDPERKIVPVSATSIRNKLNENWQFTAESTRKDLGFLVVILGTESTGKTTLVKNLSKHFSCSFVEEAGRELIADSNDFSFDDLLQVAEVHTSRIRRAREGKSPLVIADTNCLITQSYAKFSFGKELELPEEILQKNSADLYLYLCNDVPFVQDGTRLSEADRNTLDFSHRRILLENEIQFTEISGSWDERFAKSVQCISTQMFLQFFPEH